MFLSQRAQYVACRDEGHQESLGTMSLCSVTVQAVSPGLIHKGLSCNSLQGDYLYTTHPVLLHRGTTTPALCREHTVFSSMVLCLNLGIYCHLPPMVSCFVFVSIKLPGRVQGGYHSVIYPVLDYPPFPDRLWASRPS